MMQLHHIKQKVPIWVGVSFSALRVSIFSNKKNENPFLYRKSEKPKNEFDVVHIKSRGLWDPTTLLAKLFLNLIHQVIFILGFKKQIKLN